MLGDWKIYLHNFDLLHNTTWIKARLPNWPHHGFHFPLGRLGTAD